MGHRAKKIYLNHSRAEEIAASLTALYNLTQRASAETLSFVAANVAKAVSPERERAAS